MNVVAGMFGAAGLVLLAAGLRWPALLPWAFWCVFAWFVIGVLAG